MSKLWFSVLMKFDLGFRYCRTTNLWVLFIGWLLTKRDQERQWHPSSLVLLCLRQPTVLSKSSPRKEEFRHCTRNLRWWNTWISSLEGRLMSLVLTFSGCDKNPMTDLICTTMKLIDTLLLLVCVINLIYVSFKLYNFFLAWGVLWGPNCWRYL